MKKLYIACPTSDAQATGASRDTIALLLVQPHNFDVLYDIEQSDEDLVRVRSRYVRRFLETDATHMLFLDADVCAAPRAIRAILELDLDVVGIPYPKKKIDWKAIHARVCAALASAALDGANAQARNELHGCAHDDIAKARLGLLGDLEAAGQHYPIHFFPSEYGPTTIDPMTHTILVKGMGTGCSVWSRAVCKAMVEETPPQLWFVDDPKLGKLPTAAVAMLSLEDGDLLSEDLSMCQRARRIGFDIHCYLGDGAPASHVGPYFFHGKIDAFLKRGWPI